MKVALLTAAGFGMGAALAHDVRSPCATSRPAGAA